VTNYYLDRAVELHEELADDAKEAAKPSEGEASDSEGEKPDAKATQEKIARRDAGFAKVRTLVDDAEARFGDQPEIVAWAASVRAKIDGLLHTEWLPDSRTYAPPTPAPEVEPAVDEGGAPEDAAAPVKEESVEAMGEPAETAEEAVPAGETATEEAEAVEETGPEETGPEGTSESP
jgi:hypothetical protein